MIEKRTQEAKPCIFPFTFLGQILTECTILKDPEDKPWCSTKVDNTGNHITSRGYWGHCGRECDQTQSEYQNAELSLKDGWFFGISSKKKFLFAKRKVIEKSQFTIKVSYKALSIVYFRALSEFLHFPMTMHQLKFFFC